MFCFYTNNFSYVSANQVLNINLLDKVGSLKPNYQLKNLVHQNMKNKSD